MFDYDDNLKNQIAYGIGIPPELIEAAETGSGYSGRAIPLEGYLNGQQDNAREILYEWKWQIGDPLVLIEFGKEEWFEVEVESILETRLKQGQEAQQGQQQGGPPGMPGQPGAPGQGAPGAPQMGEQPMPGGPGGGGMPGGAAGPGGQSPLQFGNATYLNLLPHGYDGPVDVTFSSSGTIVEPMRPTGTKLVFAQSGPVLLSLTGDVTELSASMWTRVTSSGRLGKWKNAGTGEVRYQDQEPRGESGDKPPGAGDVKEATALHWGKVLTEEAPHVMVVGPTRSGKTTLARAIAANTDGKLFVIDPLFQPGNWGDLPAVTVDKETGDYEPIRRAIRGLLAEMHRRGKMLQEGNREFPKLTILFDEVPDTVAEVKEAGELIRRLGQRGRHSNMHLVGMSQSDRVAAWGIAGYGDVSENFCRVFLGSKAIAEVPELAGQSGLVGALEWEGKKYPIDLSHLKELAAKPVDKSRLFKLPEGTELAFNPNEPRDPHGEWTKGGGSSKKKDDEESVKINLYRVADDDIVNESASFSTSKDDAKVYLDNPGFGGKNLYKTSVTIKKSQLLDLHDDSHEDALEKITAIIDLKNPGAIGIDELIPRIASKLRDAGIEWVRVKESYPQESETYIFVGEDDPEMEEVSDDLPTTDLSTDQSGHEHKDKGPGGGQFTSKGGGIAGDAGTGGAKLKPPAHGSRAATAHSRYHELIAQAKAARHEAFDSVKRDAEETHAKVAPLEQSLPAERDGIAWDSSSDDEQAFNDLDELIGGYDDSDTLTARYDMLKEIEGKARECLAVDQKIITPEKDKWNHDVEVVHGTIQQYEMQSRMMWEKVKDFFSKNKDEVARTEFIKKANARLKELGNPNTIEPHEQMGVVVNDDGMESLIDKENAKLKQSGNPHEVVGSKGDYRIERGDEEEGIPAEDVAANKKHLKAIIKASRQAREHLRTYAKHRRELKAIKAGESMDVEEEEEPPSSPDKPPQQGTLFSTVASEWTSYTTRHGKQGWYHNVTHERRVQPNRPGDGRGSMRTTVAVHTRRAMQGFATAGRKLGATSGKIKELLGAVWNRLPGRVRSIVAGFTKILYAGYVAGNRAVHAVALAKGMTPDEAKRVARLATTADMACGGTRAAAVMTALGLPAIAPAAACIPFGSLSYLAFSTASNPAATLRAAKSAIRGVAGRLKRKKMDEPQQPPEQQRQRGKVPPETLAVPDVGVSGAEVQTSLVALLALGDDEAAPAWSDKLVEAVKAHNGDDWYIALVSAALDRTNNVEKAIEMADATIQERPAESE